MAGQGAAHRGDSLCRRAHCAAGLHGRAVAGRPGRHALRGAAGRQEPQADRAARAGRPGGGPLRPGGLFRHGGRAAANLEMEFSRNRERYQFLKWGMQAFETFKVVPPGIGIVHQVNLEYLAKGVLRHEESGVYYPDTLVAPTPTPR